MAEEDDVSATSKFYFFNETRMRKLFDQYIFLNYSTYFYHEKFHVSWLLFLLMRKFGTMLQSGKKMTPNTTPAMSPA